MIENAHPRVAGTLSDCARRQHHAAAVPGQGANTGASAGYQPRHPLSERVMIRDTIPGAHIAVVEGRSHEIYVDYPEACISALLKFPDSQN